MDPKRKNLALAIAVWGLLSPVPELCWAGTISFSDLSVAALNQTHNRLYAEFGNFSAIGFHAAVSAEVARNGPQPDTDQLRETRLPFDVIAPAGEFSSSRLPFATGAQETHFLPLSSLPVLGEVAQAGALALNSSPQTGVKGTDNGNGSILSPASLALLGTTLGFMGYRWRQGQYAKRPA
jgi:hypothetical protein